MVLARTWLVGLVAVLLALIPALLYASAGAQGDRVIVEEGVIGNATWGPGVYRVVGSITVEGSLLVEPGAVVEVAGGVTITVKGVLEARGNASAPVVFKGLGGPWRLRVVGGEARLILAVLNGTVMLQAENATVYFEGCNATGVVLGPPASKGLRLESPVVGSSIVFRGCWLGFLSYYEPPDRAAARDSRILLEYVRGLCICPWSRSGDGPAYILGGTGAYYPPPLERRGFLYNSSLEVIDSCLLLGVDLGANGLSSIAFSGTSAREVLVAELASSTLRIEGGEIAWGRGIYVNRMDTVAGGPAPMLVVHNTSIHDSVEAIGDYSFTPRPVAVRVDLVAGADPREAIDLRYNWWGDPSGPYHSQLNPEGKGAAVQARARLHPWLEEPPKPVERLAVSIEPPLPMQRVPFTIEAGGVGGRVLYIVGRGSPSGAAEILVGGPSIVFSYNYSLSSSIAEAPLTIVACTPRNGLAGWFGLVKVLPSPETLSRLTEINIYYPLPRVPVKTGNVLFNASITIYNPSVTVETRNWTRVLLVLNETRHEMLYRDGFYTYNASLADGVYYYSVLVEYAGVELAKTGPRKLVVDTSPPEPVSVELNTTTGALRITVIDNVTGVRVVGVIAQTGSGPIAVGDRSFPAGERVAVYAAALSPEVLRGLTGITIVLEDWAGNRANYTVGAGELGVSTTATTKPPTATTTTTTTAGPTPARPATTSSASSTTTATAPGGGVGEATAVPGEPSPIDCLYSPLTLSAIAVTVSVLAIVVAVAGPRRGGATGSSSPATA